MYVWRLEWWADVGLPGTDSLRAAVLFAAEQLHNCDQIKTDQAVLAHVCDPPTQAAEVGDLPWDWSQPGLHNELKNSLFYIEKQNEADIGFWISGTAK